VKAGQDCAEGNELSVSRVVAVHDVVTISAGEGSNSVTLLEFSFDGLTDVKHFAFGLVFRGVGEGGYGGTHVNESRPLFPLCVYSDR